MKSIVVFDVNETLLDLSILDPEFKRIFGDESVRKLWFAQFIQSAMVSIIIDTYKPFGTIGASALEMTADKLGVELSDEDKKSITGLITELPAHPEVVESLKALRNTDYTVVALTNSTQEVAVQQLQNAGIAKYFDDIISAEIVRRLKPDREPYEYVANKYAVQTKDMTMIAAHAWDIAGAKKAGCKTAFIARPGAVVDELNGAPDIIGKNLKEIIDKIV